MTSPFVEIFVYGISPVASRKTFVIDDSGDVRAVVTQLQTSGPEGRLFNRALAQSTATFVAFIRDGGVPDRGILSPLHSLAASDGNLDAVYFDERRRAGLRHTTLARPDFSPERLRNQFYFGDFIVYRREFLESLGGFSENHPGAEHYELALRASRSARSIAHIGEPLFARPSTPDRSLDPLAIDSTRAALEAHLAGTGGGTVRSVGADGVHDTRRPLVGNPLVSIVIPTRGLLDATSTGSRSYLLGAIRSIVELSTYTNYELVVVMDDVADSTVVEELKGLADDRLVIVPWSKAFNFSDKINLGAIHSRGDYLMILNDDVQVLTPDWIEALLVLAQLPGAGMSGAMLYYEGDSIQHAGHAYYEGDASHIGLDAPRGDPGPLDGYRVEREVSGVTAACAMIPKHVFDEVGGLSNLLPGNFNDVDLCMKVTWLGYQIYWTPHAELYHFESKTRDASVHAFEVDVAWGRWGFRMHDARYWPYAHTRTPT
jgi:hypothetical protein